MLQYRSPSYFTILAATLFVGCATASPLPAPSLAPVIEQVTRQQLPSQSLAVATLPLDGPGEARFINADQVVNPGSIMKVVTTYAALELLGPNHQWHTRLYSDGGLDGDTLKGNLYFVGSGDPKLTEERLWLLLRELRGQGIRHIEGDLVLDGSVFKLPNGLLPFHDDGNNPARPFLVEPDGVLTNLNVLRVRSRSDNQQTRAWLEPALDGVVLDNQLQWRDNGRCPHRNQLNYDHRYHNGNLRITLSGTLPKGCSADNYLSLLPQADYTAALLRGLWRDLGGSWGGKNRAGERPPGSELIATTSSADLVTMVRDINKWSNNVMARQLFLNIGARHRNDDDKDDIAAAKRVLRVWLAEKGISGDNLVFDNGAGLSRIERLTARQMATLLEHAWQSPYAAELIASLPLVAMDGTMRRRLQGSDLRGQGHIKTGTLRNVRSIAGFTRDENNTTWAVVAVINHPQAWKSEVVLDEVLQQIRLASRPQLMSTAGK